MKRLLIVELQELVESKNLIQDWSFKDILDLD